MKTIKLIFFIIFSALLVWSCKMAAPQAERQMPAVPESYSENRDTVNISRIKWDIFYKDKYLKTLIETGLANNMDLLIAMQKIEILRNSVKFNKGLIFPYVNANAAVSQQKFGLYTMDGAGNASTEITPGQIVPEHLPNYYAGFTASWEIDVWGKLRNKKKAALARYSSSMEARNAIQTAFIEEIARTYYELLSLDYELDIIRETIEIQQDALDIIKIKKETGILNELAVKQFEGQVLNSRGMEYEIQQKITINENKINFLIGQFPQKILRDKTQFNININPKIQSGIPSQLLQNRPDIRQAELDLAAAKCDVKSAHAAFYPSFTMTGAAGYDAFKTSLWFQSPQSFAYNILGGLTMPLLNRSAIKAQFGTAKANQNEALLQYQKSILNAYREVANELSNISNLGKLYDLKNQEVSTYTQSISISNDLFKTGRATYLEVLNAQRTTLQSRIQLINTRKDQHLAVINLYKTLGGGW